MPTTNATTWLREHAHNLLPVLGLLLALQAPVTSVLIDNGVPLRIAGIAFGAVGLVVAGWSKNINSGAFTAATVAQAEAAASSYLPPNVQKIVATLQQFHDQVVPLLAQVQTASAPDAPLATAVTPQQPVPPVPPAAAPQ